jgi:hypothetical protein
VGRSCSKETPWQPLPWQPDGARRQRGRRRRYQWWCGGNADQPSQAGKRDSTDSGDGGGSAAPPGGFASTRSSRKPCGIAFVRRPDAGATALGTAARHVAPACGFDQWLWVAPDSMITHAPNRRTSCGTAVAPSDSVSGAGARIPSADAGTANRKDWYAQERVCNRRRAIQFQ